MNRKTIRERKILIVDDEEHQCQLYQQEISEMGYDVFTCNSGAEAIRQCRENMPDLIIIDLILPDIHGLDVILRIMEMNSRIPVIINSAYPHYRQDFKSWAARKYILKSSNLSELKQAIVDILQKDKFSRESILEDHYQQDQKEKK